MIPARIPALIISVMMAIGVFSAIIGSGALGTAPSTSADPALPSPSDWSGNLYIYADGSLSDTSAPVLQDGNVYTLSGNINGSITDEKAGSTLNGNGHFIYNKDDGTPVVLKSADSMTLENAHISSYWNPCVEILLSSYDKVVNNTLHGMNAGVTVSAPGNNISQNTVNLSLTDPAFTGIPAGIVVQGSDTTVYGNKVVIPISSEGIFVDAQGVSVRNNSISVNGDSSTGIIAGGVSNLISGNSVNGSGNYTTGITLPVGAMSSEISENNITLAGNRAIGVSSNDGYNAISSNRISITGSTLTGISAQASGTGEDNFSGNAIALIGASSTGIYMNSYSSSVSSNVISVAGNNSYGIDSLVTGDILGNTINVTGTGVYGIYSEQNSNNISGNNVAASGFAARGMYLYQASYSTVSGNTVNASGNQANATWLYGSYFTFENNAIRAGMENGTALYLQRQSLNNVFSGNILSYSSMGLRTASGSGNLFNGNSLVNDTVAFKLTSSNSNKFYHNNFINYTSYSISSSTSSAWDNGYPSGGNYWYTYNGPDIMHGAAQDIIGSDGIGDFPFTVSGSNIDNYPLYGKWLNPKVTFTETGLAAGTSWTVNFNGSMGSTSSQSQSFPIFNGTYATYYYSVFNVTGYVLDSNSGNVSYLGSPLQVNVAFTPVVPPPPPPAEKYAVSFVETGLPAGTQWKATFNGTTQTATTDTISYEAANGSYSYSVGGAQGFAPGSYSGSVSVNGQAVKVTVTFTQVKYDVTFSDIGLPSGTQWYVNITGGSSYLTKDSSLTISLPNGTYSYSVSQVSSYNLTDGTGIFTVNGASPDPISVTYTPASSPPPVTPEQTSGPNIWIYIAIGLIAGAGAAAVGLALYYRKK